MDHDLYYRAVDRMEAAGVDREYIQGWIGGFLHNPKREEQRVTEAYAAGYDDGEGAETSNFERWTAAGD